ncbi:MAG: D-glycero-beta-D-manno-heptose 1-phosphate adenylyltransferase [Deltaproteobacteria bacterium]|nr:D-glycero-beta-D-manno-heptose 1-phosphate adenylyltransferase [Deltaproteobacteria bacterium]MBW2051703.1 D-glycero-beta-D-manno-heptose 1-phosphate adenylyltransferase [Deltaproteobacteria bacterium]MBW2139968.1 D-glycero-beta-D-manno-heptose 1-phosphate adenylyltransferase [Deltaproteobacteria bacterium]MBW2322323.1 D-glycero-beta-D-manno-heptose 1-phosphate adenylyltransferase [Deltaproteobacteria bacterium]
MFDYRDKIMTWEQAKETIAARKKTGQKIVFTNGCFDLLHLGHLRYLAYARNLGDFLVIGLNSDRSTREIKGPARPITPEEQRAEILTGLSIVDAVVIFDQPDPLQLITLLKPDVLVKGGDWPLDKVIGREVVEKNGGTVMTIPLTPDVSTTAIINRVLNLNRPDSK